MDSVYVLNAVGESTGWIDTMPATGDVGFHINVTGTNTCVVEVTNDEDSADGSKIDAQTLETYTASTAKVMGRPLPRFFRIRMTAYTSGSAIVSIWPMETKFGTKIIPTPEVRG